MKSNEQEEQDEERVVLNIGGNRFEVSRSTLTKYPKTLLGNMFLVKNKHLRKPDKKGEYFFDRNPRVFEVILDFYRTGNLVAPEDIPDDKLHDEIRFWKISFDEDADEENLRDQTPDKIFKAAFTLVQSSNKTDILEGISLLEELVLQDEFKDNKEFLYYIAYGYHRSGNSIKSLECTHKLLLLEPEHTGAKSLQTLVADKRILNTRFGFFFVFLISAGIYLCFDKIKSNRSFFKTLLRFK